MLVTIEHIFCDVCGAVLIGRLGGKYCSYAQRRMHLHYPCRGKLLPQIRQSIDKYLSAIANNSTDSEGNAIIIGGTFSVEENPKPRLPQDDREECTEPLTIKSFIPGTNQHNARLKDPKYYLFVDEDSYSESTKLSPYIIACEDHASFVHAVSCLEDPEHDVMALFHKGSFFKVKVQVSVKTKVSVKRSAHKKDDDE